LVNERFDLARRDEIYTAAALRASFCWLVAFSDRCLGPYLPAKGDDEPPSRRTQLTSEETARALVALAQQRLREAAADGRLLQSRKLARLLFDWARHSPEGAAAVRRWTDEQLADDDAVVAFARMTVSTSKVASMGWDGDGDRIARKEDRVDLKMFEEILDGARLEARVDELLTREGLPENQVVVLRRFKAAPRKSVREH
jgi:hypothetical protein